MGWVLPGVVYLCGRCVTGPLTSVVCVSVSLLYVYACVCPPLLRSSAKVTRAEVTTAILTPLPDTHTDTPRPTAAETPAARAVRRVIHSVLHPGAATAAPAAAPGEESAEPGDSDDITNTDAAINQPRINTTTATTTNTAQALQKSTQAMRAAVKRGAQGIQKALASAGRKKPRIPTYPMLVLVNMVAFFCVGGLMAITSAPRVGGGVASVVADAAHAAGEHVVSGVGGTWAQHKQHAHAHHAVGIPHATIEAARRAAASIAHAAHHATDATGAAAQSAEERLLASLRASQDALHESLQRAEYSVLKAASQGLETVADAGYGAAGTLHGAADRVQHGAERVAQKANHITA